MLHLIMLGMSEGDGRAGEMGRSGVGADRPPDSERGANDAEGLLLGPPSIPAIDCLILSRQSRDAMYFT